MKSLKEDIKNRAFSNCYLFYGEEDYLRFKYEEKLLSSLLSNDERQMNLEVFEGKIAAQTILNSADTMPFLAERRVVLVKNSKLFLSGRKDDSELISEYFKELNSSTVLIFNEDEVDKRGKAYKNVAKYGKVIEFKQLSENEIGAWVLQQTASKNLKIEKDVILFLIKNVGASLSSLKMEVDKLIAYKNEGETIVKEDILCICTISLDAKVFDLVDAICSKDTDKAISIYRNLVFLKEHPIMILALIIRQFRLLYECKVLLFEKLSENEIASRLNLRSFMLKPLVRQCKNYSASELRQGLSECLSLDNDIKTGKINGEDGVLLFVTKWSLKGI